MFSSAPSYISNYKASTGISSIKPSIIIPVILALDNLRADRSFLLSLGSVDLVLEGGRRVLVEESSKQRLEERSEHDLSATGAIC